MGSRWGVGVALGHLGDARHAAGDADGARAAWEEALTILDDLQQPEAGEIRAKLMELDAGLRPGAGR